MNKFLYFFYLFLLGRNILLLSNGYSNKTTGVLLLINMLFCFILALILLFKSKKYNVYLIVTILSFSIFYIYYSGYSDMNKDFNKMVYYIFILLSIVEIIMFVFVKMKESKKVKTALYLCFCFIAGILFLRFLNNYYQEPKKIVYSTWITSLKDKQEMLEIIGKMPGIKSADIIEDYEKSSLSYEDNVYYHYNFKESLEPSDLIIDISLKTLVDDISLDSLAYKIQKYIKLSGLENDLVRIYIVTDRDDRRAINIYDFQNNNMKIRYKRAEPYIAGSSPLLNIFSLAVKILKGVVPEY